MYVSIIIVPIFPPRNDKTWRVEKKRRRGWTDAFILYIFPSDESTAEFWDRDASAV